MLTDFEVRLINLYGDMVRDEAAGRATQKVIRIYGKQGDLIDPHIHAVLREIREDFLRHGR